MLSSILYISARVVTGNVRAMESALEFAHDLDELHLLAMHHALLAAQEGWSQYAGRYRDGLVWVGGRSPRDATYVAPQPELVKRHMDDVLAFLQRDDLILIDILVRCRHIVRGMRARLWNVSPMPASMPPLRVSN